MKNSEMLNNLYKILRMNIILAKSSGEIITEDTLQSFDDTAKKIDEDKNNKYEDEISKLYFATKSLEEEADRLEKLIDIIDKRLEDRSSLLIDYRETTSRDLEDLGYIKDEDKVDDYKIRLNNIKSYLSNRENISKIEEDLVDLHAKLDKCYEDKQKDEKNNATLEDDLLLTFKNSLSGTKYSDIASAVDVDFELEKIKPEVEEQLRTLNTFDSAFNNLLRAGISRDNQDEYANYVVDAKRAYYEVKEKEFLYRIYKVIIDNKNIYNELFVKRDELDNILEDRLKLRVDMSIFEDDILTDLYEVIEKQNKIIAKEKKVIDDINEIEDTIKFKETRLNELKEENRRVDILALLQEYGIIDTYKSDNIEVAKVVEDKAVDNSEDKIEEVIDDEVTIPNMVVQVKDAYTNLNVGFARSKADTVMRRVGRSLGYTPEVKKDNIVSFDFNTKKEIKKEEPVTEEVKEENIVPAVNSLSTLNLDDLNLDLKLDNNKDENKKEDVEVHPIFPDINVNVADNNVDLDANVDKDFWSAEEDKEIFPSVLTNNEITINKDQPGFKLGSPVNIGGYDESRN